MTTIVGVHGVGNYAPGRTADDLAAVWARNISEAMRPPRDIELAAAYYAPALRRKDVVAQGADDLGDIETELSAWFDALGMPPAVAQGRGSGWIRDGLDWVARTYGLDSKVVTLFARFFFREVLTYLRDPDARQTSRGIVEAAMREHQPRVLIAHSLGSVVAYETLHAHPELTVDLWLTLGSPLGMPDVVRDRLDPALVDGRGTKPPGVRRWVNIADRGDLISIPRHLSRIFDGIDEDLEPSIHALDCHLAKHYLRDAATIATIVPYL